MFVILDTNHFTELADETAIGSRLITRLQGGKAVAFTTIITSQEVCQGWCALINRQKPGQPQVFGYQEFQHSLDMLHELVVLPFDEESAAVFHGLQDQHLRIGTMDLKIAAICLAHDGLLLTRNLVDFEKVPNLRGENWLD